MRVHNHKWNIVGRRITALLLLCGLLLPFLQQVNAASVTYEYKRIQDAAGLPTDNQWHDYFIAWEDTDDNNKVWFTDYHWYTADGYNNYDAGGTHWMEYKAASTLPDSTSSSFTSKDSMGHMQIKYAGRDEDNNSPMYYIRVSKMNGGYVYFTEYEPSSDVDDAEPFTFQDKGSEFHIFVNLSGKADRYLTRDGQYLETTESSSYGGGEYWRPLRVYQRTFTVDETVQAPADVIGKVKLYEYSWVNTVDELMELAKGEQWTNVLLAWEDSNGSQNNPDKVWYTKEVWYEAGEPNYNNDGANDWCYYSNDYIGSDGYGSPQGERFLLPSQVGHFQVKRVDWDDDNPVDGYTGANGKKQDSPVFHFRFDIGRGRYVYIGNNALYDDAEDAEGYTVQLRLGKKDADDRYGSVWIINNITADQDELFCRYENYFSIGNWNHSDYWEFPFRLYTYREVEYDAIVKSFTVGKGANYSIDRQLILGTGVTITVEDGGVLTVDNELLNNGKIIVKNGGTVIVNEGGYIMAYDKDAEGSITLDGGNLIVMDGAKVICDQNGGVLKADNGTTILNRGLLMVGDTLSLNHNSSLENESNAMLLLGGKIAQERGSIDEFTYEEIASRLQKGKITRLLSNNSKIINKGRIIQPLDKDSMGSIDTESDGGLNIGGGNGPTHFG